MPRILLALAAADTSRSDLREFLHWVDLNGIEQTAETILSLKIAATDTTREHGRNLFSTTTFEAERSISEKQLVARIEKLMLESGLTKTAIVQATISLLKERGYPPKILPDSNKIAFKVWIERLLRRVPAEELLNIASVVRNHAVHGIDWPLRREKP